MRDAENLGSGRLAEGMSAVIVTVGKILSESASTMRCLTHPFTHPCEPDGGGRQQPVGEAEKEARTPFVSQPCRARRRTASSGEAAVTRVFGSRGTRARPSQGRF